MGLGSLGLGWLAAGAAALATFWGQLKGIFAKFNSLFFVRATLEDEIGEAVMANLWLNFKRVKIGSRVYFGYKEYVRPLKDYNLVAFEKGGATMTFFKGWKPVFISSGSDDSKGGLQRSGGNGVNISFVRGMFDLDTLINESVESHNKFEKGKEEEDKKKFKDRYTVRKYFGRYNSGDKENSYGMDEAVKGVSNRRNRSTRPLLWTLDDLGSPIAESPFKSLFYSDEVNSFLEEIRVWVDSEKWFKDRGLPWRMGAGLKGTPGTGKSSFVRAVGQTFDIPIDVYDLSSMSNEELVSYWQRTLNRAPVIALFEDIDRLFDKGKLISQSHMMNKGRLTMDCLLNCISGVESSDGVLTFITANDVSKLDPALGIPTESGVSTRPGRLDRVLHFGALEEKARKSLANIILSDCLEFVDELVSVGDGETGAQFGKRCADLAIKEFWKKNSKPEVKQNQLIMN